MRINRIYQPVKLILGQTVTLTPEAGHHLVNVLRLAIGETIHVFNGEDGEFIAKIASIHKHQVAVQVSDYLARDVESPLAIHLGQAISRGEKMDYTIQKAVELGAVFITPLFTERCGVKLSQERWEKRLQRWRAIAIAACEQSGRNKIPTINLPMLLLDWLKQVQGNYKFILHPTVAVNSRASLSSDAINEIILLVGPEGGFSAAEVALAIQQGFHGLKLGPRILRTETAALAAIAILQAQWGDVTLLTA